MRKSAFLALLFTLACGGQTGQTGLPVKTVTFPNNARIQAELALTPPQQERGLMYRYEMDADKGMLFIFETERPQVFWMKNTFIDLDMLFLGADKKIKCISKNVAHSTPFTLDKDVATAGCNNSMYVLELAAGTAVKNNLAVGDKLEF